MLEYQPKKEASISPSATLSEFQQAKQSWFCDRTPLHIKQAEQIKGIPCQMMLLSNITPIQRRIPSISSINLRKKPEVDKARQNILETIEEINCESPQIPLSSILLQIMPDEDNIDIPEYEMDNDELKAFFLDYIKKCKPEQVVDIMKKIQFYYPQKVFDISQYHQPLPQSEFDKFKASAIEILNTSPVMNEIKKFRTDTKPAKKYSKIPVNFNHDPSDKKYSGVRQAIAHTLQELVTEIGKPKLLANFPDKSADELIQRVSVCDLPALKQIHSILVEKYGKKRCFTDVRSHPISTTPDDDTIRKHDADPIYILQQTFRDIVPRDTTPKGKEDMIATNPQYEMIARDYLLQFEEFIHTIASDSQLFYDPSGTLERIGKGGYNTRNETLISDDDLKSGAFVEHLMHEYFHKMSQQIINDDGSYMSMAHFYAFNALVKLHNADHYISVLFPESAKATAEKMSYGKYINRRVRTTAVVQDTKIELWNHYLKKITEWSNITANRYFTLLNQPVNTCIEEDHKLYPIILKTLEIFNMKHCKHRHTRTGKYYLLLKNSDYALAEHVAWQYYEIQSKVCSTKPKVMNNFPESGTTDLIDRKKATELIGWAGLKKERHPWLPEHLNRQVRKLTKK